MLAQRRRLEAALYDPSLAPTQASLDPFDNDAPLHESTAHSASSPAACLHDSASATASSMRPVEGAERPQLHAASLLPHVQSVSCIVQAATSETAALPTVLILNSPQPGAAAHSRLPMHPSVAVSSTSALTTATTAPVHASQVQPCAAVKHRSKIRPLRKPPIASVSEEEAMEEAFAEENARIIAAASAAAKGDQDSGIPRAVQEASDYAAPADSLKQQHLRMDAAVAVPFASTLTAAATPAAAASLQPHTNKKHCTVTPPHRRPLPRCASLTEEELDAEAAKEPQNGATAARRQERVLAVHMGASTAAAEDMAQFSFPPSRRKKRRIRTPPRASLSEERAMNEAYAAVEQQQPAAKSSTGDPPHAHAAAAACDYAEHASCTKLCLAVS